MRTGFHARLFTALAVTLVAVGAGQYFFLARDARDQLVKDERVTIRADAGALARFYTATAPGEVPLNAVNRYLRAVTARPGFDGAKLVDSSGAAVASSNVLGVGAPDGDQHVRDTLGTGSSSGGPAKDFDRAHGKGHILYTAPVKLPGGRWALVATQRREVLDAQLGSLQQTLILVLIGGIVLAIPAFYVFGGRSLGRMHRAAVARASRDGLTDLGNHRAFQEELDRAVSLARRHGEELALAVIDIDDFKFENDRCGHAHGDWLLCSVAGVLRSGRREDGAFRVGGDEFAMILPRTGEPAARIVLDRVIAALEKAAGVTLSGGLAVVGPDAKDAESLRDQAGAAMYEAKGRGGGRAVSFAEIEGESQVVTVAKVRALRRLLEGGHMSAVYQPVWDLERDEPFGYEALARPSDEYGLNGPAEAFEVAGAIGHSAELDELCRRTILAGASKLPEGALLFLNVAPQSLDHDRLAGDSLARVVRAAGLEPERVVLEVTERFSGRVERIVREARRLRELGFKLALDDVGTGNSGLEMLRELEVDYVKVDRGVIVDAMSDPGARAVLVSIMAFAHQTGSYVIAEGIEDPEMLDLVRAPSVGGEIKAAAQGAQGYFFGRPGELPARSESVITQI